MSLRSLMYENILCLLAKNLLEVIIKGNEFHCLATRCINIQLLKSYIDSDKRL